jgi:hypothetical protein
MRRTSCWWCALAVWIAGAEVFAQQGPTPELRVVSVRARVDAEGPGGATEHALQRDEVLRPGAHVTTRRDANAAIRVGAAGELHVGELTTLVLTASNERAATLEHGAMRVVVLGGSLTVETPGGAVAMARGEYRVHVDSSESTRVVTYSGRATISASHRTLVVAQGMGAEVSQANPAEALYPPIAVPRAPVWTRPFPSSLLALNGSGTVEARYAPPPAQRHPPRQWVQTLARDEGFGDLVFEREVAAGVTTMRAENLAPGVYFARVVSVDRERFESLSSATQRFEIAAPRVNPSVPGRRAEVIVPRGVHCRLDGTTPAEAGIPLPLVPARAHELVCSLTADLRNPVRIAIPVEEAGELVHEVSLLGHWTPEGGSSTLAIRLRDASGQGYTYANIHVTGGPGVTFEPVREETERGLYRVGLSWAPNTPLALDFTINGVTRFSERFGATP